MVTVSPDLKHQIKEAVGILRNGGIIAYPTDTVYGLGASMNNEKAVERIFDVKGRPKGMALPLLVSDRKQFLKLAEYVPPAAWLLIYNFLPGAITIVLKKSDFVPDIITAGKKTVAIRIPDHPVAIALIKGLGAPIVGTSANLSGQPSLLTAKEVADSIEGKIDMVLDGGTCPGGVESTIVDFTGKRPVIKRKGAIALEELQRTCPEIELSKEIGNAARHRK